MKTQAKIFIGILIGIILVFSILSWKSEQFKGNVLIQTDKTEYQLAENLKIKIQNNFKKATCFSSCYPYFLEKKNGEWKPYTYGACQKSNINEICIDSGKTNAFEIKLSLVEEGLHRIALPVCDACKVGENFKESKRFYSNEFEIKEKE